MQFDASLNSNGATFGWLLYLDLFRIDTKVFMSLFFSPLFLCVRSKVTSITSKESMNSIFFRNFRLRGNQRLRQENIFDSQD